MKKKVSFSELINGDKPVLVDFFATWCGPCIAMGPILKEVAGKVGEKATIVKIDVDQNPAIAQQLSIQGVPTFMVFRKGEIVWRQSGMQSAHQLVHVLEQASSEETVPEQ
jgi:thioredoxin 1